jgi:hypothetical protein
MATLDSALNKLIQLGRQVDIAGWHREPLFNLE